jgi:ABC-type multidrug transport system ATPase subunit
MLAKMQNPIIQFDHVSRRFGGRNVLKDIDLEVPAGSIAGLVGPNGSGKTTLLKLMAGFIKTTSGDVRLFGYDPFVDRAEVMRRARFAFAPPAVYGSLTAREHLKFLSATNMRPRERSTRDDIMAVLETVGLADRADDKAHTYSFGMKQRLNLAQALLPMPALLVFDEPTDGLDPIAVVELRGLLKRLQTEHNLTLVLSSHLLGEIEKLVDTIFMLNDGRQIFCGSPDKLLGEERQIMIRIEGELKAGVNVLRKHGIEPQVNGDGRLLLPPGSIRLDEAVRLLGNQGLKLMEFHEKQPGLEDAYIRRLHEASDHFRPIRD